MKMLICEDEQAKSARWQREVAAAIPSDWPKPRPLINHAETYREVFARLRALREETHRIDEPCELDDQDIILVDYDLEMYGDDKARHTGEELARMCRMVSNAGYIIVMNQFNRKAHFDLRLTGKPNSYADLNISAATISQKGLWQSVEAGQFRPWIWDDIVKVVKSRRSLTSQLTEVGLDSSILEFLSMPPEVVEVMPDEAYEHLSRTGKTSTDLLSTTFRQFLSQQVESLDIDRLIRTSPQRAANLAVSRTAKWLSRMVVGPQDLLVDIPHLLERLPFLMNPEFGDPADPHVWQRVPMAGFNAIVEPLVADCAFAESEAWLGRQSLWWPKLDRHPLTAEMRTSAKIRSLSDVVFAEDRSIFIPYEEAEEFKSDFRNRFSRRWAKSQDGLEYEPKRRLLEA
ncbi:hypothetical protein O6V14_16900 [Sphingomonas faeni]|uniref:hypothetical protein n=1 Tax=Sphingomonas faeni TaxID=185950 RepID=UPI00335F9BDB